MKARLCKDAKVSPTTFHQTKISFDIAAEFRLLRGLSVLTSIYMPINIEIKEIYI